MITMGSPYFVWINANEIISLWYLLGAVCVTPPAQVDPALSGPDPRVRTNAFPRHLQQELEQLHAKVGGQQRPRAGYHAFGLIGTALQF